jgi:hypothetical protein
MDWNRWMKVRLILPYGLYFTRDGRVVLYNRKYQPIMQLAKGVVSRCEPTEWIEGICAQFCFYNDSTSPRINKQSLKLCESVLNAFEHLEACNPDATRL